MAPIGSQELWACGVTYMRSKIGRQEESKDAGGGDFYARVYDADRPELFFKASSHRVVGPGQPIRIGKLAVDEQVGGLLEGPSVGEVVDAEYAEAK